MKYYSKKIIQDYIEDHKDKLNFVEIGMEEDWFWTAEEIWSADDGYNKRFKSDGDRIEIAGICGSIWATPVMKAYYKDNEGAFVIPCYVTDNKEYDSAVIEQSKAFAMATGGMDSVYETI